MAVTQIGVRELKNQATEIIREVREQHAEYIVTYRGKPVAIVIPFVEDWERRLPKQPAVDLAALEKRWAEWDELAREVDEDWQSELGAVELLSRDRR